MVLTLHHCDEPGREAAKHTPGPWEARGERIYIADEKLLISCWPPRNPSDERAPGESWLEMRERTQPERDEIAAETRANARLIAAAPTLADALREARLQIQYLHEKFAETGSGNQVLARIDAALKAAGCEQ